MDRVWHSAPAPALRITQDALGQLQVHSNEAAARWATRLGLVAADWQVLAARWWQQPGASAAAAGSDQLGPGHLPVRVQRVPLDDTSWLLWLQPAADAAGQGPAIDPLAERHRAETLTEHTQLAAEAIGVGFWSRNLDAGVAHWDEQMYRIHHRMPALGPPGFDDWIGQHVHPQDQAWVSELHARASQRWDPVVDATFRAPDGAGGERWVQSWTRRLVRDGQRLAFGMHMDVTDRQRAQALLQRERERTQFAIEAAELGVWERGLDGLGAFWNDAMYRLRGLDPADPRPVDALGQLYGHPEDLPMLNALVERHLADGTPYRFEFRVRRPDGAVRWLITHGRALRDTGGRLLGMAGINLDITERKQADALRLQKDMAEQAARDQSAFLARVSHELRTPMNAVLGFAQLLGDDVAEPPSPRQRERLQRIHDAGLQMMSLVDDLLDLASLQAAESTAPAPLATSPALHVLCIEDNPVNLLLVRELLALRPGVRLRAAVDGQSGITMALAEPPDVLLLDLQLPDISGLEVLRRLRAEPALARCVFVALSANAMPDHIAEVRAAGCDDYWTKPINFPQFLAGIDRLAARAG